MSWILVLLVLLISALQANSSGIFELRVISFDNEAGKDDFGKCCSGITDQTTSMCKGTCRPRFRVCLKEYQVKIDTTSPCTFGDVMTKEMRLNNMQNGFENTIVINFPFTWPGTFSLIVEAWQGNQTLHGGVLVSRLTRQKWLDVNDQWTEDVHNSKYTSLKFEYRVTCNSHYYGKGCENLCRARDDNFGHYSCSPMGERVCFSGWTGDYCTEPRCLPGCDEQHGQCNQPNECRCQSGWEGPLCNQCQRYPGCMHGTCTKPWDCLCNEGWGGLFCNQDLNFCTNHRPCRNGGTCFNTGEGSFTCSCPSGFYGKNCDIPSDDCTESPCSNGGTCANNGTMNICVCPAGYEGTRCDTPSTHKIESTTTTSSTGFDQPKCNLVNCTNSENSCQNNGSCVFGKTGTECQCLPGFAGKCCETNIDDCSGNPCLNGGTCIDKTNEFECECVPGYFGPMCQNRVEYWSSSAAPSARLSSESKLTTEHVIVIATISTFVPLVVLVAVIVIVCLKQRRKREQARADEEARLQNEQNTANSSLAKRGAAISPGPDHHIIRNSWGGKCTNNTISSIISSQKQFT